MQQAELTCQFEELYRTYYQQVVNYLNTKIGNFHDAQDLASSIFEYCYRQLPAFDAGKASLKTWLYVIVNSRYKNYLRDRRAFEDVEDYMDFTASDDAPLEQAMEAEEERKWLAKALEMLPERQKQIVVLKYFTELNSAQIAQRLKMTESNVRVQLFRAMKRLQELSQISLGYRE